MTQMGADEEKEDEEGRKGEERTNDTGWGARKGWGDRAFAEVPSRGGKKLKVNSMEKDKANEEGKIRIVDLVKHGVAKDWCYTALRLNPHTRAGSIAMRYIQQVRIHSQRALVLSQRGETGR